MRILLLVLVIALGGAAGGWLALTLVRPDEGPPPPGAPEPPDDPHSYYLREWHRDGLDVSLMTPLLLSPLSRESIPQDCPDELVAVTGDDSYAEAIRPYLDAIGDAGLAAADAPGLAGRAARELQEGWRELRAAAVGPVADPPLRILVKHYPRPRLPGRCVTIHATFYDMLDVYLDHVALTTLLDEEKAREVPGVMIDLRRTYQLASGAPRLVEAVAEVHRRIAVAPPRKAIWHLVGPEIAGALAKDRHFGSHFMAFGAGERLGFAWCDRSFGLEHARRWAAAYRIRRARIGDPERLEIGPLTPAAVEALLALVRRA